jgi:hypothetical protein
MIIGLKSHMGVYVFLHMKAMKYQDLQLTVGLKADYRKIYMFWPKKLIELIKASKYGINQRKTTITNV